MKADPSFYQIITSGDGSHTIFLPHLNETYHSSHGAIAESEHIYIKHGLLTIEQPSVRILEIGFGTGLNALLTYNYSEHHNISIIYDTLEPFPLASEVYTQLNYCEKLGNEIAFKTMHQAAESQCLEIGKQFAFTKYIVAVQEFIPLQQYDLIYFDAFAPSKQSEMWEVAIFQKMYACLRHGGVLVTYCASGQFKRNLAQAGFTIETLPGPPGKKQMTRAVKG